MQESGLELVTALISLRCRQQYQNGMALGNVQKSGQQSPSSVHMHSQSPAWMHQGPAEGGCDSFIRPATNKLPIPASSKHTLLPLLYLQTLQQFTEMPEEFFAA